MLLNLI